MKKKLGILYLLLASFSILPSPVLAADPVSINLDIESANGTIFKGPITVTECAIDESHASSTSGYCAVEQSGVTAVWSSFGDDKFLDSINGIANDSVAGNYWGWFSNLEYGQTSLNAHLLSAGENLLVQIASVPLQVSVSTSAPEVGATTTVTVLGFGFDSSFNPVWTPATNATVSFAGEAHTTNSEGKYDITATSTNAFTVTVSSTGFITSDAITISPIPAPVVLPDPVLPKLILNLSTSTPYVGSTTTVSVSYSTIDDSMIPISFPATTTSVTFAGETHAVSNAGTYDITATSTDSFSLFASGTGFIDSDPLTVTPISAPAVPAPDPAPASTGGGSSGVFLPPTHAKLDVPSAVTYLLGKQKVDGSFGSSLYSDWAVIALAAAGETSGASARTQYLARIEPSLSSVTDYERHAMALMAAGINPYSGTAVNYIQKIIDAFDGRQVGDSALVNDDIFAVFPLMRAGHTEGDSMIQKIIAFIISKQREDGSWEGSVDVTAAAVQSLTLAPTLPQTDASRTKAKEYLKNQQKVDGGFGSSFSTSWVMQAISALGEIPNNWLKNDKSPEDSLALLQQADGGVEPGTAAESTRIWATSYAIPATLHKPWASILQSFIKPTATATSPTAGGSANSALSATTALVTSTSSVQATSTATSTSSVQTPTSSTTSVILQATSTVVVPDDRLLSLPEGGRLDPSSDGSQLEAKSKATAVKKITPKTSITEFIAPLNVQSVAVKRPIKALPPVASTGALIPNTPVARTATTFSLLGGILLIIALL